MKTVIGQCSNRGGYDYDKQAWVKDGHYLDCAHPYGWDCRCYGRLNRGVKAIGEIRCTVCGDTVK